MLQKTTSAFILGQQVFNHTPEGRIAATHLVQECLALDWLERQCGLEKMLHELVD